MHSIQSTIIIQYPIFYPHQCHQSRFMSFLNQELSPDFCCFFYREHQLVLGWIESQQGNKVSVWTTHATKALSLKPNRLELFWKPPQAIIDRTDAMTYLKELHDQLLHFAQDCPIEELYELSESNTEFSLEDLVSIVFADSYQTHDAVALFFALEQDRRFFKRKEKNYMARTAEEIALIDRQNEALQKKQKFQQQTQEWIQSLEAGTWNQEQITAEQKEWLRQIFHLLVNGKSSAYWQKFADALQLKTIKHSEMFLLKLLQQAECQPSFGRLALLRAGVKYEFETEIEVEAQKIVNIKVDRPQYAMSAFTIDGATTKDYDDAISIIEYDDSRMRLAVHISDLSGLSQDSVLFQESLKRVSSVYTVKQNFPMLPKVLSEDYYSLHAGQTRRVLSFYFEILHDGNSTLEDIKQQWIEVARNYTYDEVDDLIEKQESFWNTLSRYLEAVRLIRLQEGALDFPRKEVEIKTGEPIEITLVDRDTFANRLVEELAILVNQASGNFFDTHQIPALYRTQTYEVLQEVEANVLLSPRHVKLESTQISTNADAHQALGCMTYVQNTSPIRRVSDLMMQLQMVHYLQNQTFVFSEEILMGYVPQIETRQQAYNRVTRDLETYWKFKYLKQHEGEELTGRIQRSLPYGRVEILLDAILLTFTHAKIDAPHQQTLNFKIIEVDVEYRTLSISYLSS